MNNLEITETRLMERGWKKVGNTFYRSGKAVTHFENKFQVWTDGAYHQVKTIQEIQVFVGEKEIKKA
jgi:hypothetical protein